MAVNFTDQEKIKPQESPTARKFQRLVKAINTHIFHKGISTEDPSPFEHHAQSIMWDDGLGGGKSVYVKLLSEKRILLTDMENDSAATLIISHLPDAAGDQQLFLTSYDFVCDGRTDTAVLQASVDMLLAVGGGKMFLKHGTYEITTPIRITIPKKSGMSYPHVLEIEGERGTALNCRVVSEGPAGLQPAMFHVDIAGENRRLNRIVFKNLAFFSNLRSTGKFVTISSHGEFPHEIMFEGCTFAFGESAYAISATATELGASRIVFKNCLFRRRKANYFASAISIIAAGTVEFLGCGFYDTRTAEDTETDEVWDRLPYVPFCAALEESHHVHVDDTGTILSQTGAETADVTIVSRHFVHLEEVHNARFVNCEFKHYDVAIRCAGEQINTVLTLDGNLFYQLGAYLTSINTAVARSMIVMASGDACLTNNVFLVTKYNQFGERNLMSFCGTGGARAVFVYNVTNAMPQFGPGTMTPNFWFCGPAGDNIRAFRVWKTERDRGIVAFPDVAPKSQIIGGGFEDEEGFERRERDITGDDLAGLPWCSPKVAT